MMLSNTGISECYYQNKVQEYLKNEFGLTQWINVCGHYDLYGSDDEYRAHRVPVSDRRGLEPGQPEPGADFRAVYHCSGPAADGALPLRAGHVPPQEKGRGR